MSLMNMFSLTNTDTHNQSIFRDGSVKTDEFPKTSRGGRVIFNPKNYVANFGPL